MNPHPDMLDHWVWSRYLSFSYYEHPPMIAWLIRGITLIGGNTETALEIGSQLVSLSYSRLWSMPAHLACTDGNRPW